MKKLLNIIRFFLTWHSDEAVKAGVVRYSGQGRNEYGE